MALLLLPTRWVVQPSQPVEIDPRHGLVPAGLYLGTAGVTNLANGQRMVAGSAVATRASAAGFGLLQNAVNTGLSQALPALRSVPEYTAIWHGVSLGTPVGSTPAFLGAPISASGQSQSVIGIEYTSASQLSVMFQSGGIVSARSGSFTWADVAGHKVTMVASYSTLDGLIRLDLHFAGKVIRVIEAAVSSAMPPNLTGSEHFTVGPDTVEQPSRHINSNVALAGVFYGRLRDALVPEILANPWQLFRPVTAKIWVPGGGAIAVDLVIADAHQGHAAGNAGLSLSTVLAIAGAAHAHTADSLALSTVAQTDLVVANAAHLQAAGSPVLTVDSVLVTRDAQHAQLADHVALSDTSSVSLATGSASHGHTAQSVGLTADSTLAVDNADHAHVADSVMLGTTGAASLNIASALHSHQASAVTLTSASVLAVQNATHAHVADAILLSVALNLVVASANHAHSAASLDLSGVPSLEIASAHHAQVAGLVVFNTLSWLQVADAWHAQVADHLVLQYSGQLTRAPLGGGYRRARVNTMRPFTGNTARPRR